jgi:hypothetical protein
LGGASRRSGEWRPPMVRWFDYDAIDVAVLILGLGAIVLLALSI